MEHSKIRAMANILREAGLGLVSVRMSKVAFHLDYLIFPPVIVFCLYSALGKLSLVVMVGLFILGLIIWTLAEYLLHRFVLHAWPYFAKFHQAHHDEPRAMVASPTLFSLAVFATIGLVPAVLLLGFWPALPCFAGFLSGYVAFAAVHETVHHSASQHALLRHFKRLHARHHHGSEDLNFGVLTSFWDRVFGTYKRPTRSRIRGLRPAR